MDTFVSYKDCSHRLNQLENELNHLLVRRENVSSDKWIEDEIVFANTIAANFSALKDLAIYNEAVEDCRQAGLSAVVEAYEKGFAKEEIIPAYQKGLYYALIEQIINSDDVLAQFKGITFENTVKYFKELDQLLVEESKKEIYKKLVEQIPGPMDSAEVGKELTLLKKAIGNNGRNLSLRALFDMIPNILLKICPCMLMSPNSVAQYLAQKNNLFDVVIFDEASQLPTCKSVGALYRGKSAIIVGDPKQMPPTSFFAGNGPEINDLSLEDLDSILDDTIALGVPSQHLKWHYRSSHESLIAFSNHQFYENKMFTFPSANDREKHVTTVHVNGVYKNNTNIKEAEAIVEEIIRRYKTPSLRNQSIGVVAFNIKQQALIENLLAKQFQQNPELDIWANNGEDPIFVKNLENVQGDERDVILFSIAYGPDEKGKISMNFGPINQAGGGKRLNVAFSRSRISMIIYSSMLSSDIRVTSNSPEGVIAFRDFLEYADGHDFIGRNHEKEKLQQTGLMESICQLLLENDYQYQTKVGHSDFQVDIAIVDPFDPTHYMLGILLDGKSYFETKNTKDREISQINVLKNLGWDIQRIWSIDWLDDCQKVKNNLLTNLHILKEKAEEKAKIREEAEKALRLEEESRQQEMEKIQQELSSQSKESVEEIEEEEKEESSDHPKRYMTREYVSAEFPITPMTMADLSLPEQEPEIRRRMEETLILEAPITKDSLFKRVWNSFAISRSNTNILEIFEKILNQIDLQITSEDGMVILWKGEDRPEEYREIRISNQRNVNEICHQEVRNAICHTLKEMGPMDQSTLVKETSLLFGYKRLGKNLEEVMEKNILKSLQTGHIQKSDDGKYILL